MPIIYEKCGEDDDAALLVKQALKDWHGPIRTLKPIIDVLFAEAVAKNGDREKGKDDVKLHGYPCAATIKQNSYKDRVAGKGDIEIVISRRWWDENVSDESRLALIDHELTHLEVKRDADGELCVDDLNRPRFKIRLHDWELGGFTEVCRRHKQLAVEAAQAIEFITGQDGQMLLSWAGTRCP